MKKKIALYANGWNAENLYNFMEGVTNSLPDKYADIYVFLGQESYGLRESLCKSEMCIYDLPDFEKFDGIIFFGYGMNFPELNKKILSKCQTADVPFIYVGDGYEDKASAVIHTDNYLGMKKLADSLLSEHDIDKILFVAGPKGSADSDARLNAVIDSMKEHGKEVAEEDIFYSNWEYRAAVDYVREHYKTKEDLPDAIVCANDTTAIFVSLELEDMGFKCPEDVLLTGFDGIDKAKTFYPSITSVGMPFRQMGSKTAENIIKLFGGEDVEKDTSIPCIYIPGESTGSDKEGLSDDLRREACRSMPQEAARVDLYENRITYMYISILHSEHYSTLHEHLQGFFYMYDSHEGNPFYIFVDPELAKIGVEDVENLPKYQFSETLDLTVGKVGKLHLPYRKHHLKYGLLPVENYDETTNHVYVFMPLYHESFVCGYMVMADRLKYFENNYYTMFKSGFNRSLESYKKNLQLNELNSQLSELLNKDPMTSTKNRIAYENYKKKLSDEVISGQCDEIAFAVFDINKLKYINDNCGHEQGDEYIKNASKLICDVFKHSPVFRIGGDEFVAVLRGGDYASRDSLFEEFIVKMEERTNSASSIVEKVSIAIGIAAYDSNCDKNIDATIKRADEYMYINKRMMKQKEG